MQYGIPENASAEQVCDLLRRITSQLDFRNPFDILRYSRILGTDFNKLNAPYQVINDPDKILTRARKHCETGTLFTNISEMMCPPKHKVGVNRANIPGEPIYYCSNDPGTSVYEIRPQVGDWITTLDMEFPIPKIEILALGLDENTNITGVLTEIDKGIHMFLAENFRKEILPTQNHFYYHTAIFIKHFIGDKDGIRYPSVGSNLKGLNIALKQDFVNKHAKFKQATTQVVLAAGSRHEIKVKCLYNALRINRFGDFYWKKVVDCEGHTINENIYL